MSKQAKKQENNNTNNHSPTVYIVDSIMGQGKTTAAYNYMMEHVRSKHFIFVTNTNDNVETAYNILGKYKTFTKLEKTYNKRTNTKYNDLLKKLRQHKSLIITHAMLDYFDNNVNEIIKSNHYIMIMDEIHDIICDTKNIVDDVRILIQSGVCSVENNGFVTWNEHDYKKGNFLANKILCEQHRLVVSDNNDYQLLKLFPISVFEAFDKVLILTYLYQASLLSKYFDLYHYKIENIYVKGLEYPNFSFTTNKSESNQLNFDFRPLDDLIHIYEPFNTSSGLNDIGFDDTALSINWYQHNAEMLKHKKTENQSGIIELRNNMYNYARNKTNAKSNQILWTAPKEYAGLLKGKGYTKGFLSCTAKGDNQYRDRNVLMYCINRYMQPNILNYFRSVGIDVNNELYALSEMLQWIWRSAIRDGKPIYIYIPSVRMRSLLLMWLGGKITV